MEIRIYDIESKTVVYTTNKNFKEVLDKINFYNNDEVEIQLVYTSSLMRRVDPETFRNACKYILAYIKTEYYSGQLDGSFTITDAKEIENLLPNLASINNLVDEDINLKLKEVLNEYLSIRLISCNRVLLNNPYAVIDGLLWSKEIADMNRQFAPQNDYSEYLISHIVAIDKVTNEIIHVENEDKLFALIFSNNMLSLFDKETLGYTE